MQISTLIQTYRQHASENQWMRPSKLGYDICKLFHYCSFFVNTIAQITVAVIVVADALLLQIPKQFNAPLGENGFVRDIAGVQIRRLAN